MRGSRVQVVVFGIAALLAACGDGVGSLSGKVTSADGPLAGAIVTAAGATQISGADGAFSFGAMPPQKVAVSAAKEGYVAASADVTVVEGREATLELKLEKVVPANHAPLLTSFSASPTTLAPGGHAKVLAAASDEDGDALTFTFTVDEGWTVTAGDAPGTATLVAPATSGAQATLQVKVTDSKGGEALGQLLVDTAPNHAPLITSIAARPQELAPGATTTVEVSATDADGDTLAYAWKVPEGWTLSGEGAQVEVQAPASYDAAGRVEVTVTDKGGATATASLALNTAADRAPIFSSVVASPTPVAPGGSIEVTALVSDPDGDPLVFAWTADEGWTVTGTGAAVTVTAPLLHAARTTLHVLADDGHGKTTESAVVLSTTPNAQPLLTSLVATPPQVAPGGTLQLDAVAVDADGELLTYAWTLPEGWTSSGSDGHLQLVAPAAYGLSATVQLVVQDPFGAEASGQLVIGTTSNHGPIVAALAATPAVVAPGGKVAIDASASDPDGDALAYAWALPDGWTQDPESSGGHLVAIAPATYATSGTFTVTVSDGALLAAASVVVSTRQDVAPQIASVSASSLLVARKGTLTVTANASDADLDPLTYAWTASAGWTVTGTGATVTVTAPDAFGATGTIGVSVSDGTLTAKSSVLVGTNPNIPPTLTSIGLQPAGAVFRGTSLTASIFAIDANGDPLTYTWKAPAGWTVAGSGTTVTVTAPNTYGSAGKLQVDVSDGTDVRSATADVSTNPDRAPVITSFGAASASVLPGSTTTLTTTADDADGDTLTYSYSVVGTGWKVSGTSASPSLTAPTVNGSSATVTAVVSDGFGGTATKTFAVTSTTCAGTTMNCDGTVSNGCESDLASDHGNCGQCGVSCGSTQYCVNSACVNSPYRPFDGTTGTTWEVRANISSGLGLMTYHPRDIGPIFNVAYGVTSAYDVNANAWTTKSAFSYSSSWTQPAPVGGNLYIVRNSTVYRYSVAGDSWTALTSVSASDSYGMTESDEYGHVYGYDQGGRIVDYDTASGTVNYYSTGKGSQSETRLAYDPRSRSIYFGAYSLPYLYRFDLVTKAVTTMASIPAQQLNDIFCSDRSGHIYAAGNTSGTTMFQYDIASNTWKSLPTFPVDHGNVGTCTVSDTGYLYVTNGAGPLYRIKLN